MTYVETLQVQRLEKQNLADLHGEKAQLIGQIGETFLEDRKALSEQLVRDLQSNPRMESIISQANTDAENITADMGEAIDVMAKELIAAINETSTAPPTNKELARLVATGADSRTLQSFGEKEIIQIGERAKSNVKALEKKTQESLAKLHAQIRKENEESMAALNANKAEGLDSLERKYEKLISEQEAKVTRIGSLVESLSP